MNLHTKSEDFHALIQLSAKYKNIPESAVERDYFIVIALQHLAESELGNGFVFSVWIRLLVKIGSFCQGDAVLA